MRANFLIDCWKSGQLIGEPSLLKCKCTIYRLAPHAFDDTGKCSIPHCQNIFGCVQPELEVEIQETLSPARSSPAARFFLNLLVNEAVNQFVKGLREGCLQLSLHVGVWAELLKKGGTS